MNLWPGAIDVHAVSYVHILLHHCVAYATRSLRYPCPARATNTTNCACDANHWCTSDCDTSGAVPRPVWDAVQGEWQGTCTAEYHVDVTLAQARYVLTADMVELKEAAESAIPPEAPASYITAPWTMYMGAIDCGAQGSSLAYTTDVTTCVVNAASGVTCDEGGGFKKIDDAVGVTITAGGAPGGPITVSGCKLNDGP